MRRKKAPTFNPFNPKDRERMEGKIFADEWVKHNAWMGDENDKAKIKEEVQKRRKEYDLLVEGCPTKIRMPTFEQWLENPQVMDNFYYDMIPRFDTFYPPVFFNFQEPIPVPKIREEIDRYEKWEREQEEKLAIFNEMLGEKGIRAGRAGVGEAHKGWGRSKRKY